MDIRYIVFGLFMFAEINLAMLGGASAQVVVQDNFTGASSKIPWVAIKGACLTAGDGSGTIPSCIGSSYYGNSTQKGGFGSSYLPAGLPDPVGNGALRLTNADYYQHGAIVYNSTFPTNKGIQVTFTTYTYGGDSGGGASSGADGISFYLMDGAVSIANPPAVGATGGSLGYSCSNGNYVSDGLLGGYLGLGIDEYGNFLNDKDNTDSGWPAENGFGHDNYQPGRIGLRGAGSVSWTWLNQKYSNRYPSFLNQDQRSRAVQMTCESGKVVDYSNTGNPFVTNQKIHHNYDAIPNAYKVLPTDLPIANEAAATRDEATPIAYKLKITPGGLLSLSYSYNNGVYQPVLTNRSIKASNGPLPGSFRFGFAASTGGHHNVHEIGCFQAAPAEQSASSAEVNLQQSGQVKTGTQIYLSYYHSDTWWGQLTSQDLVYNQGTNNITVNPVANWDATCGLTGGACAATGKNVTAIQPDNRDIYTWDSIGNKAADLTWSALNGNQKNWLNAGDSKGIKRLDYLRGERKDEIANGGSFRDRDSLLGDIIGSSPIWVGPPSASFPSSKNSTVSAWKDALYPAASMPENSSAYGNFQSNSGSRLNVVYSGSNDGMLHGFRAGSMDASGNFVNNNATPNDGTEIVAFMPNAVLETIHNSSTTAYDYSSPQYAHNYFVDSVPGTGDLFYGGAWHSWLVSGLGAGGKALFALDVTDPKKFTTNNFVIGEWSTATAGLGNDLGQTYGTPQIRRFHNGQWGAVFGNGMNSASGNAGVFIMLVDGAGNKSFRFLKAGGGGNSILFATAADLDGDHITDFIYAGDVKGNIWRFDVMSNNADDWEKSTAFNLFSAPAGQPITTKVLVASTPSLVGAPRIMVMFGTGQKIPQTVFTPEQYVSGAQSIYGVWDSNMKKWNEKSSTKYASINATVTVDTSSLTAQSLIALSAGYRGISNNPVCWKDSTTCASDNNKYGWKIDLAGEQIVFSPVIASGAFIVNTLIPPDNAPSSCNASLASGWTLAVDPSSGGGFPTSFFADSSGAFVNQAGKPVNGVALSAVGSPSVVNAGGQPFLITQTSSGQAAANKVKPQYDVGGRLNWIELR